MQIIHQITEETFEQALHYFHKSPVFDLQGVTFIDPYGMVATGSSLVNGAAGDVLCVLLLELRGYTQEAFGETHPGGAVGRKLAGFEE